MESILIFFCMNKTIYYAIVYIRLPFYTVMADIQLSKNDVIITYNIFKIK